MKDNFDIFYKDMKDALKYIDLDLSDEKIKKFYIFYEELIETNKYINLTAITDMKEVIYKHFIDSLSLIKVIDDLEEKKYKIIDIGTGAGFPGIPLAIAFDNINLVLLDSLNKRLRFINSVIEKINLKNVSTIHGRAEDFSNNKEYREKFDLAVSRAVANLSTLSEISTAFIKKDTFFISYKSEKADEEIENAKRAFEELNLVLEKVENFDIYIDKANRKLLKIKKIEKTNKKYPRKAGIPAKEPL